MRRVCYWQFSVYWGQFTEIFIKNTKRKKESKIRLDIWAYVFLGLNENKKTN